MTSRTARTLVAVMASAAVLTSPGLVGVASAHQNGPAGDSPQSISTLGPELQTAVKDARLAYFTSVQKARSDYRDSLIKIRTSIQTDTGSQLKAVQDAKNAYDAAVAAGQPQATLDQLRLNLKNAIDAYRTALTNAKTAHQGEMTTASKALNDAITAAGAAYTKAVTDAFTKLAPGTTPPPGLLTPPGRFGHKNGHDDQGLHLGWSRGRGHQNGHHT